MALFTFYYSITDLQFICGHVQSFLLNKHTTYYVPPPSYNKQYNCQFCQGQGRRFCDLVAAAAADDDGGFMQSGVTGVHSTCECHALLMNSQ